jgi:formylglycine-generating enzyme required for sulfatase activity
LPRWTVDFETLKVDEAGNVAEKSAKQAFFVKEELDDNTVLEMVEIPGGSFQMGSPESEARRASDEGPQHTVNVQSFLMGKYPVTQAQWQAIANLPKVNLDLDPDPSGFKGSNRPVEQVSWNQAVEFCDRLSQKTGRTYRLPSEAEWEYACRASTTTPFHFGETITTDLANYDGNYTYGSAPKGIYREQTTDVGSFPPNALGLYDMHGNVWEWCLDHYHDNYTNAPTDGSARLTDDQAARRLLRGGSWFVYPADCRSADRIRYVPGLRSFYVGFRVVLRPASGLLSLYSFALLRFALLHFFLSLSAQRLKKFCIESGLPLLK